MQYQANRRMLWSFSRRAPSTGSCRLVGTSVFHRSFSQSPRFLSNHSSPTHPTPSPSLPVQVSPAALIPSEESPSLSHLPPPAVYLRIFSASFNQPSTGRIANPNISPSQGFIHSSPGGEFKLVAVPPTRLVKDIASGNQQRSIGACFTPTQKARFAESVKAEREEKKQKKQWELRLLFMLKIKVLGKGAVVRKTIRKKWIYAMKLVVLHGATGVRSSTSPGEPSVANQLEYDGIQEDLSKWLLKDHTYVVHPTLKIKRLSIPRLVQLINDSLVEIQSMSRSRPTSNHPSRTSKADSAYHAVQPQRLPRHDSRRPPQLQGGFPGPPTTAKFASSKSTSPSTPRSPRATSRPVFEGASDIEAPHQRLPSSTTSRPVKLGQVAKDQHVASYSTSGNKTSRVSKGSLLGERLGKGSKDEF